MKVNNVSDWFQVFTSIGVLAGLVLVAYELNQAKSMSLSSIATEVISKSMEDQRSVFGENPVDTIAKACLRPEDLTENDYFILDAFYENRMIHLFSIRAMETLGEFEIDDHIDLMHFVHFSEIANTPPGRAWLKAREDLTPDQQSILHSVLQRYPKPNCESQMREFMEQTTQGSARDV